MSIDIARVRQSLPKNRIEYYDSLPSTQPVAMELAAAGAKEGTAVIANQQTAGIGRQGHSWHSEPETGLYVSLILYPPLEPATRPVLTLAIGLAAAEAIARVAGFECDLRWPNDILINERKAAGILVQLAGDAAVAGIGVNVNNRLFPPDIANLATSLALAGGRGVDRTDLLIELIECAAAFSKMLKEAGKTAIFTAFTRASSYASGKRVVVDMGDRQITGMTAGLDENGFLRVMKADGTVDTVLAGGVRPL